jgi:hypothetical protein
MKFDKLLDELKKLKLPADKFAIFGSGPLSIRGLRESNDLDIIVKKDIWDKLDRKFMIRSSSGGIVLGNIDVCENWLPWFDDLNMLIDTADIIDGIRYVKLEYVLKWKKEMNRDKDKKDVKLIDEFLKMHPQQ